MRGSIGVKQFPASPPAPCPLYGSALIDPEGHHLLMRGKGGGSSHPHSLLRGALASIASEVGLLSRIEAPHLLPQSLRRPAMLRRQAGLVSTAAFDAPVTSRCNNNLSLKQRRKRGLQQKPGAATRWEHAQMIAKSWELPSHLLSWKFLVIAPIRPFLPSKIWPKDLQISPLDPDRRPLGAHLRAYHCVCKARCFSSTMPM